MESVCTVAPCAHNARAAQSVKWKMIDEKEEMVWEGELVVVMLIPGKSKSLRAFVSLPACMWCNSLTSTSFY